MRYLALVVPFVAAIATAVAQSSPPDDALPTFEVASVKSKNGLDD